MSEHNLKTEMTKNLVTVESSKLVEEAYQLMFNNKIRHLPVVDKTGTIVGLISDRDIQRAMHSEVGDSYGFKTESIKFKENTKVSDYMVWPVKSFDVSTDLKLVVQKMIDTKVSSFLIKEDEEIVGIVTTDDFLHLLHHLLDDEGEEKQFNLGDVIDLPLFGRVAQMASDAGI
jgi:acetoin utilization protein AcuB